MDVDPAFLAFLQSEEARAYDGSLLEEVEAAIKSYNGDDYGDEEDGRSQVVARDVAESADYMLTSLVDVMVGNGRVVEFEPSDESDEDVADDATEAMHYIYRRKSGYRFIHDWGKAGLLEKIGIAKSCVERKIKRIEQVYHPSFLPENAIEAEETGEFHEMDGAPLIKAVTLEETAATFPDYQVPLEEFRFSGNSWDFDKNIYLAHLPRKTISDLVEMGFDAELLEGVEGDTAPTSISLVRDGGNKWRDLNDRSGALREVTLCEEYVLYDLDGDGIAERLCVHRVGNTVLNVEKVDYQPFEYWCPFPMQGRVVGQSLADKSMDIQRVNTVVERLMLDSGYQAVSPGTFIHEDSVGDHTLDDLLTVRPGRIVRFTGAIPPIPEQRPDITATALQIIDFKRQQLENRTGITRLNKGVDEDTLNDTAQGQAQLMARGQQMERYVIRNFAEGVARLFMKKVGLMRKYAQPFRIRVDGEYREVDPSQWPEDMEVQVTVGLGSGSKQDRIMYRNLLAQAQMVLKQAGSPIVTDENIYNLVAGGAKDMGFAPNDFFTHPEENPQEPQPDPAMMEAQAKLQIEQQKAQTKAQLDAAQAEHKAQLGAQEQQRKFEETVAKHQLEQFKASAKAVEDQRRAEFEARLATMELQFEQKLAAQKQADDHELKKNRPGGDLSK